MDKKAKDRLRALPSEMQAIKLLHDRNCVISEMNCMPGYKKRLQPAHLDVTAFLPEEKRVDGKTCEFGIDVKSHTISYQNVYLETQTRPDRNGNRRKSWAFCDYEGDTPSEKHNRYLLEVADSKDGVSLMELADRIINIDISEEENTRRIIRYFSEHQGLLTHDVTFYSYEHINDFLERTGGADLANRVQDRENRITHVMEIVCDWQEWDERYGRAVYSWSDEDGIWHYNRYGSHALPLVILHDITRKMLSDGTILEASAQEETVNSHLRHWRKQQSNGLSYERFCRIIGLSY